MDIQTSQPYLFYKKIRHSSQKKSAYKDYLKLHNLAILNRHKFREFIKQNIHNDCEILYLETAGLFDITLYNIPRLMESSVYLKAEEITFKLKSILKFFNIKSISPGLVFLGKKQAGFSPAVSQAAAFGYRSDSSKIKSPTFSEASLDSHPQIGQISQLALD